MARPNDTPENIIRKRKAEEAKATEARMAREREQLNQKLDEFTERFTVTVQAALKRLERSGFPDGELIQFPDQVKELAAWEIPNQSCSDDEESLYYLASNGRIYEDDPTPSDGCSPWSIITPKNVRSDALNSFEFTKDIATGIHRLNYAERIVERCDLICPDKSNAASPASTHYTSEQPPEHTSFWKRLLRW